MIKIEIYAKETRRKVWVRVSSKRGENRIV